MTLCSRDGMNVDMYKESASSQYVYVDAIINRGWGGGGVLHAIPFSLGTRATLWQDLGR